MSAISIQALPTSARDAARLARRLGVPMHEIALHAFPDGEMRVRIGPAAPTTIVYASLDRPNDKLIALVLAAEALRRDGLPAHHPAGALSLLHAPGCRLPRRRGDQPESDRPAAFRDRRPCHHGRCPFASYARHRSRVCRHRGRQSLVHAGRRRRIAQRRSRSRYRRDRARCRVPTVGRAILQGGSAHPQRRAKDPPWRPLR